MTQHLDLSADALAGRQLVIDGVDFRVAPLGGFSMDDNLVIVKPMSAVEAYRDLLGQYTRPRMIELGIAYGGSVGLHAVVADPARLVALELAADRVPLLDRFIAERHLQDRVKLYYGTDQADRPRVTSILADEFGGEPLDLVIDDASHLYDATVASFETLFPHLRPGGEYIIEDWNCDHTLRALLDAALSDASSPHHGWARDVAQGLGMSGNSGQAASTDVAAASLGLMAPPPGSAVRPLSRLAAQLVLGPAEAASGIASVTTNEFWIAVRRSDTPLDPGSFSLADACRDHFGTLST